MIPQPSRHVLRSTRAFAATLFVSTALSLSAVSIPAAWGQDTSPAPTVDKAKLEGRITIDGSSTVYPITEAIAEAFGNSYKRVKVTIGVSGTGGGFKKFVQGETDINNASRPIKDQEILKARKNNITPLDVPVAYDGISVVVHPKNTWADTLTATELKKLWEPNSTIKQWSDLRAHWPQRKIKLYGPGADSGTFDYFTEKVNGKSRASRNDYTASEDDSVLVKGVAGDRDSLGYFGFAYYEENKSKLQVIKIQDGDQKPIAPTLESIADGSYYLARPIYIYVSRQAAQKKSELQAFVRFYLQNAKTLVGDVGYIPLSESAYGRALTTFQQSLQKTPAPSTAATPSPKTATATSADSKKKKEEKKEDK